MLAYKISDYTTVKQNSNLIAHLCRRLIAPTQNALRVLVHYHYYPGIPSIIRKLSAQSRTQHAKHIFIRTVSHSAEKKQIPTTTKSNSQDACKPSSLSFQKEVISYFCFNRKICYSPIC